MPRAASEERGRDRPRHRRVAAVTVDRGGDEARDEQVERVAGNRQHDEARDGAAVGDEQPSAGPLTVARVLLSAQGQT